MKIFLDANILVSVLNKEFPLFTYSSRVVSLSDNSQYTVYTSPLCLGIAFYFAEKMNGNKMARNKINLLTGKIGITTMNEETVKSTVFNKSIADFEDGLEYYSAIDSKCKCIVTSDKNDFYFSEIEVLNAHDFLLKYAVKKK